MNQTTNTEQNRIEPRKIRGLGGWGVVVIRSLFILLFAVILLGGLYFKAPWKISVLDAFLLALLTVVPKRKRKYGWLALAAGTLTVTAWIFIPEKNTGEWQPYTFDEEVAILNAKYGVPDEENAARFYEQIELTDFYEGWTSKDWDEYDVKKAGPDKWDPDDETLSRPWKAEEFPELAAWLETEKEKFTPFFKATACERCWFKEAVCFDSSVMPRRDINLRRTTETVKRTIYNDLANFQTDEAFEKSLALIKFSKHIQQQYTLIENLIGYSTYIKSIHIACDIAVNYPVNNQQLQQLKWSIDDSLLSWDNSIASVLEHEKVDHKKRIGNNFEVNNKGKTRKARNYMEQSTHESSLSDLKFSKEKGVYFEEKRILSKYWQKRQWKFYRFLGWLTYAAKPEGLADIIDIVYTELKQALLDIDNYQEPEGLKFLLNYDLSLKSIYRLLCIEMQMPSMVRNRDLFNRAATVKEGAWIIIALRHFYNQNGYWPNDLDAVYHPGHEFVYKTVEKNFFLYHTGPNKFDDKGKHEPNRYHLDPKTSRWIKVPTADDVLIWPKNEDELKQMLGIEEPQEPKIDSEIMEIMF